MDDPTRRLKVIGVTGTNGKTTTTWLIRGILEAAGIRTGLIGTLEYSDGDWAAPSPYTTPPAPVLSAWLARMEATGCTACSDGSRLATAGARPHSRACSFTLPASRTSATIISTFTIRSTTTRAAKANILSTLATNGFAVLNSDDPVTAGMVSKVAGRLLTVGIGGSAERHRPRSSKRCRSEQKLSCSPAGSEKRLPVRPRMTRRIFISLFQLFGPRRPSD